MCCTTVVEVLEIEVLEATMAGITGWKTTPEMLSKAVSQSGWLSEKQHLVLRAGLLLSHLCTSVTNFVMQDVLKTPCVV